MLNVRARAHRNAALVIPVILVASIALANVYQQTTKSDAVAHARDRDVAAGATALTSAGWVEHPVDRSHRIDPWPLLAADRLADGLHLTGATVAIPAQDRRAGRRATIGMVLGDGAHVRLRVAAILDGSSRNRSIILPTALLRAHVTPARAPTRRRSTCGSRSPSSA